MFAVVEGAIDNVPDALLVRWRDMDVHLHDRWRIGLVPLCLVTQVGLHTHDGADDPRCADNGIGHPREQARVVADPLRQSFEAW